MNILFIGDIVGRAGRRAVRIFLDDIVKKNNIDFVFDGRNCLDKDDLLEKGIVYKGIGK